MKEITIQTIQRNEKIEESKIMIEEGETLIATVPENYRRDEAYSIHERIVKGLSSKSGLITIPDNVKLKVIKVN